MRVSGKGAPGRRQVVVGAVLLALLCLALAIGAVVHALSYGLDRDTEASWSQFNRSRRAQALAAVEEQSKSALRRQPLSSRSATLLALARETRGDQQGAEAMMRAAAKLNRRDPVANLWLFQRDLRNGRFDTAFVHIDAYLRRRPDAAQLWTPILAGAVANPAALTALAERLAGAPPWRRTFYRGLPELTLDTPDFAYPLLAATLKAGSAPTAEELSIHLGRMVNAGRFEEAFRHWRALSDSASPTGGLNNGNFDALGGASPFGWGETPNGNIEQASAYGRDENALRLHYDGFSNASFPAQLLMLKPGGHRLEGEYLTESPEGAERIEWTLRCADRPDQVLMKHVPTDTAGAWRRFSIPFSVPASGCVAQWMGARVAPGVKRVNVGIWYDRLAVSPIAGAPS